MIEEDLGGFPRDEKLMQAIYVSETLEHVILLIALMDQHYAQMIIDRLNMMGNATKGKPYSDGCFAVAEALNDWLDERNAS